MKTEELKRLTDDELIESLKRLARDERKNVVQILQHLQVMDDRHLAPRRAYDSLFDYCIRELRWAEGETAKRIQVARTAVRFPVLLRAVRRGLLNLSTAALLAPHLTRQNYAVAIRKAYGRGTRQVEAQVAILAPSPEPRERARFLGIAAKPSPASLMPSPSSESAENPCQSESPAQSSQDQRALATGPQRVLFSFTSDETLLADVERAKELLRARYANPGFEEVFGEALRMMLDRIDPERRKGIDRPAHSAPPGSARNRNPPSWVKRAVWQRDTGCCAFKAEDGRRCRSRSGLQFDHIVPWALGGRSDDPANIRLLCRTHNRLEARRSLGDGVVDAALAAARERREP